jgi:hypothetical protein
VFSWLYERLLELHSRAGLVLDMAVGPLSPVIAGAWTLGLAWVGLGVWTGRLRSWVMGVPLGTRAFAIPWFALFFSHIFSWVAAWRLLELFTGTTIDQATAEPFLLPAFVWALLGLLAPFAWPRWTTPPWYRDWRRREEK